MSVPGAGAMIPADHPDRLDRLGYLKLEGFIAPDLR